MTLKGKVWKFGDDINTDLIIPARYLTTSLPDELAKHCMEDADPSFSGKVNSGDIIVAGKNFGCGSSREHAPISIKALGISTIIASSFARIFFRNSFNIGLPIFECGKAANEIKQGDDVSVDITSGVITNHTSSKKYKSEPIPPFMQDLIKNGGLMAQISKQLKDK